VRTDTLSCHHCCLCPAQKSDKASKPVGYQDIRRLFGKATQVRGGGVWAALATPC
jgi:hypothetical protein